MPSVRPRTSCAPSAERDLDDRAGVLERGVEGRDTACGRGPQVDLVRPDAERAQGRERGGRLEHLRRDVRLGADAEQVDTVEGLDQLGLVERTRPGLDLEPGGLQDRAGVGMQVLEEEGA
jgi:hypothetical protein